jgi:protein-tyrosine sulfotransferase
MAADRYHHQAKANRMTREQAVWPGGAAAPQDASRGLFVLSPARSGSTLLRYLLDSHPAVACPPESPLGQLCKTLHQVWREIAGAGPASGPDGRSLARATVNEVMRQYLAQQGKQVWCEKSPKSVLNLRDITATFPDARYICLYRHAMDMVASGIEASRWGYGRYGFQPYVERRPDNLVAALGEYWADRSERILELERAGRCATVRLTYEDLVGRPHETLVSALEFIGIQRDAELVDELISSSLTDGHSDGRQDHKIGFSGSIHTNSVGRGRVIPAWLLGDRLRERINGLLEELGYALVDDGWNTGNGPLRAGLPAAGAAEARQYVGQLFAAVTRRLDRCPAPGPPPVALKVADTAGGISYLDLATARVSEAAPGGQPGVWATSSTVLGQLITGQIEVAQAVEWGLMRRVEPARAADRGREGAAELAEQRLLGQMFAAVD